MKKQTLEGTMLTPMQLQEKAVKVFARLGGLGPVYAIGELSDSVAKLFNTPSDTNLLSKTYLSLLVHAQKIGVSADDLQILASQRIRIDELKLDNEAH